MSGVIEQRIRDKIGKILCPSYLEVVNESSRHQVPPGSESHFKLVVVSDGFKGASLIDRHRRVHACLSDELASGVHALALHLFTVQEWTARQGANNLSACRSSCNPAANDSPPCLGGGRGR